MSFNLSERYATNSNSEVDGVKVDLTPDSFIKIRRAGGSNKKFDIAVNNFFKIHKRSVDDVRWLANDGMNGYKKIFSQHILVGWGGIADVDENGNEVVLEAYTPEQGYDLFVKYPEFFDIVKEEAEKISNFQDREDLEK